MMAASPLHHQQQREKIRFRDVLFLALSLGAATGFLEGAGLYGFQASRWAGQGFFGTAVALPILYLSPLFTLLVFGGVALLVEGCLRALRIAANTRAQIVFGAVCFLACFDWLALTDHLGRIAVITLALGLASAGARWFGHHRRRALALAPRLFTACAAAIGAMALAVSLGDWQREHAARAALPSPSRTAPNVVLIILDTVRADHLSVYGYERKTTPFLETLAANGTVFDDAVSTSSWTLPSHVSILTGRYPREHGANLNGYDGRYATVASSFERLGYLTAGFSANMDWFASGRGMTGGFQHFEDGFWSTGAMFANTGYGILIRDWLAEASGNRLVLGYKRAEDVNRTALQWLDAAPKRPFFLVLNYYDANSGGALPLRSYRNVFTGQPLPPPARSAGEFAPGAVDRSRSDEYDGSLSYIDSAVKQFLESLRQRGLAENLVVVVTADHGDLLGEHGLLGHRNALYWDLIHVPLIFWGVAGLPRGLRIERPVSLISLPATLLEIAGQNAPGGFPAPSLAQLWKAGGDGQVWPFPVADLAQMNFPGLENNPNYSGALSAIVTPRWLLIHNSERGATLYDWPQDPENLRNLAARPGAEALSTALLNCLRAKRAGPAGESCEMEIAGTPAPQFARESIGSSGEQ